MADLRLKSVLLVDDEAAHRLLIRRALSRSFADLELLEAGSVSEARDLLTSHLPLLKLAILDFNLDHECGLEVLQLIRATMDFFLLPCIVISTSDLEQDMMRSYAAGCNAYLVKGEDPSQYQSHLVSAARFFAF